MNSKEFKSIKRNAKDCKGIQKTSRGLQKNSKYVNKKNFKGIQGKKKCDFKRFRENSTFLRELRKFKLNSK